MLSRILLFSLIAANCQIIAKIKINKPETLKSIAPSDPTVDEIKAVNSDIKHFNKIKDTAKLKSVLEGNGLSQLSDVFKTSESWLRKEQA